MAAPVQKMTASEFLAWERGQTNKHEFVEGDVFAMAGATREHVRTVLNLSALLDAALRGRPCDVLAMDMKLRIDPNRYFYPDVLVTCSERDRRGSDVVEEPTVVIEVLSASTAAYDRGDKFWAYQQVPSLQEYVLVDADRRRVEVYRRDAARWSYELLSPSQPLHLKSLGIDLAQARVFENLEPA